MLRRTLRRSVQGLGTVPIPGAYYNDTYQTIQTKCADYAKQKAIDDVQSGKVSDLTSLQNDVDACTASMDRGRQIRQAMVLTSGFVTVGLLSFWLSKRM